MTRLTTCPALLVTLALCGRAHSADDLTFEQHIRPILKANCFVCHGEEEEHQGNLDLRLVRLMTKGGDGGPAIVAGKAGDSPLVQRLEAGEMPPEGKSKPLTKDQIATIRKWLDQGAKTARPEPTELAAVSDDEKNFWSFQPIRNPPIPLPLASGGREAPGTVDTGSENMNRETNISRSPANPIDAFLLAELEKRGLGFSPTADQTTLLRRASFDLLGLPPAPEEVDAKSPDWYDRYIDQLLSSPRYGERWGRHWLDVAGYADSDGYTEKDPVRQYAYKYRDYVVRAFNSDKPWDAFLREQLAGDELLLLTRRVSEGLPASEKSLYANLLSDQADLLAATGFLRMAPDGTADGGVDQNTARNDVIAETIKIASSSLLGLTVGCAQCHNHRYDPIPQADYYSWRAIFEPAYDTKNWRKPAERLVSLWTDEVRQAAAAVDAELKTLADERQAGMDKIVADIFEAEVAKLPEDKRELARQAKNAATADRTPGHKQLLKDHPSLNVSRGSAYLYEKKRVDALTKEFDDRQKVIQAKRPADDFVPCLTEVPGNAPPTFVFFRGDISQPKQAVQPGELSVLSPCGASAEYSSTQYTVLSTGSGSEPSQPKAQNLKSKGYAAIPLDDPALPTTGRRLAYASSLTNGHHPLTARVLVNRFWLHHFGRGIVATPADFGVLGTRPSHPELLDWLASEFMNAGSNVESQKSVTEPSTFDLRPSTIDASRWSLKRLHRLMMTSAAYRQQSRRTSALDAVDPDNALLGRMSVRRLEAESLRDSILAAAGALNLKMHGPPVPVTVDEVGQVIVGLDNRDSAGRPVTKRASLAAEEFRRSVYVQVRRSQPLSMLETFDAPVLNPNCELRNRSTVAPQSLLLMNNDFVLAQAQMLAERVIHDAGEDSSARIRLAWRMALAREASDSDLTAAAGFVAAQEQEFAAQKPDDKNPLPPAATRALASLCQALFSSNAFLYVD